MTITVDEISINAHDKAEFSVHPVSLKLAAEWLNLVKFSDVSMVGFEKDEGNPESGGFIVECQTLGMAENFRAFFLQHLHRIGYSVIDHMAE